MARFYRSYYQHVRATDKLLNRHGKQLLERAEDFSREIGCDFITVHTFDVEARDFYLSHGFELELERPGYQGGLLHLFLFKKEIL